MRGWVKAWADLDLFGLLRNAFHDPVKHAFLDIEARTGAAALSVIEEDGEGGTLNSCLQVHIVEEDVGRLAAEFERDLLKVPGSRMQDQFADLG